MPTCNSDSQLQADEAYALGLGRVYNMAKARFDELDKEHEFVELQFEAYLKGKQ
jgi:hypothetical protein